MAMTVGETILFEITINPGEIIGTVLFYLVIFVVIGLVFGTIGYLLKIALILGIIDGFRGFGGRRSAPVAQITVCPYCSKPVAPGTVVCGNCGRKFA